jgi:hypothetical protein
MKDGRVQRRKECLEEKGTMTATTNGVRKPEVEFFWSQPLTSYYNGRLNPRVEAPVSVLSIKCARFLQY